MGELEVQGMFLGLSLGEHASLPCQQEAHGSGSLVHLQPTFVLAFQSNEPSVDQNRVPQTECDLLLAHQVKKSQTSPFLSPAPSSGGQEK